MAAARQTLEYMGPEPTEKQVKKARRMLGGATPNTKEDWFEAKEKTPYMATVTPAGDLYSFPVGEGHTAEVIPFQGWLLKSPQEIKALLVERRTSKEVKDAEAAFATAKRDLREITQAYKNGEAVEEDVVRANHRVREADSILNALVKFPRFLDKLNDLLDRDLTLNVEDVNPIVDPVYAVEYTTFPSALMYTPAVAAPKIKVRRAPTAADVAGADAAAAGGGGGGAAEGAPTQRRYTQAEGARIGAIRAARAKQQGGGGFVHKMQ
jgi:hypothetical protein